MIEIGDRVVGKSTGTLTPSTVIAKMVAPYYIGVFNKDVQTRWDDLYPLWKEGNVYITKFDEPVKNCTYAEFKIGFEPLMESESFFSNLKSSNSEVYEDFLKYRYDIQPSVYTVAYPEEDLEIL